MLVHRPDVGTDRPEIIGVIHHARRQIDLEWCDGLARMQGGALGGEVDLGFDAVEIRGDFIEPALAGRHIAEAFLEHGEGGLA